MEWNVMDEVRKVEQEGYGTLERVEWKGISEWNNIWKSGKDSNGTDGTVEWNERTEKKIERLKEWNMEEQWNGRD